MRRNNLDLLVVEFIALLNVVWALLPNRPSLIGTILALPLLFVLPGYTLTEVLFHQKLLNGTYRLVLSLGLSLALAILGGFILNALPGGLQALSWAVFLGLLTTAFALLVAYLRRRVQGREVQVQGIRPLKLRFSISAYLVVLAAAMAILSVLYAVIGVEQQPHPGFTQLWMLPAAQNGTSSAVNLGIRSFEATTVTYRVTMTMNGQTLRIWPSVVLKPDQTWNQVVPIAPDGTHSLYIEAQLYRLDQPQTVYRNVHLTLHPSG
ncbi:MAG TPA: DUF1616 domain-containing protein [Ktedonobacteraceae bacterium]|nr:DUF1616 domain-containing protein [Ktedonobacteraceae bacterium]